MNIGITISNNAYTPEAYAYNDYLVNRGHLVQLDYDLDPNNDLNIYFMGMRPFWGKPVGKAKEIHEYHSLSTPPHAKIKNRIKKHINKKADGRIYLNSFIKDDLNFKNNIPFIFRDMGVEQSLFQERSLKPDFDIIYCGSIAGRIGLIEVLLKLSKSFKVIIVGKLSYQEKILLESKNCTLAGQVNRNELPDLYRNARFGLNYTPDIYPYNIQTSTKTLEYLASGLDVISNKYTWSEDFFRKINYKPSWIDLEDLDNFKVLNDHKTIDKDILANYSWNKILLNSNFENFLKEVLNEKYKTTI